MCTLMLLVVVDVLCQATWHADRCQADLNRPACGRGQLSLPACILAICANKLLTISNCKQLTAFSYLIVHAMCYARHTNYLLLYYICGNFTIFRRVARVLLCPRPPLLCCAMRRSVSLASNALGSLPLLCAHVLRCSSWFLLLPTSAAALYTAVHSACIAPACQSPVSSAGTGGVCSMQSVYAMKESAPDAEGACHDREYT